MHLVLALCLAAISDGGAGDAGDAGVSGVELTVYRSAAELPETWRALLPADFDFHTQQLATRARPGQRVELSSPRFERAGGVVMVTPVEPPPQRECPPCRGIHSPMDDLSRQVAAERVPRLPLYVVPRTAGKVLERERPMRLELPPCPPCLAP